MQIQVCKFRRTVGTGRTKHGGIMEKGIAKVNHGFGTSDLEWIIDESGAIVKDTWDYELIEGPLSYIDTEYK